MIYYNEFNPESAILLSQLMKDGIIPQGDIDTRSITEVKPDDIRKYTQCHFFAGIGGWSIALRLAGWSEDRKVWTGSCPCQPFSSAGRQKGKGDDRHLWPVWERLIGECRPPVIFGEQVSSAITHGWLDDVYQGLESKGYAVGSAILPACSVGAPHKRDRLWFVAHSNGNRRDQGRGSIAKARDDGIIGNGRAVDNSFKSGLEGQPGHDSAAQGWQEPKRSVAETGVLGDAEFSRSRWGNPCAVGDVMAVGADNNTEGKPSVRMATKADCVLYFARRIVPMMLEWPQKYIYPLRGKNLACWCKQGEACHADILLTIVNQKGGDSSE